ncbi:MAG: DUF2079 domain-containing protein [Anaerolineales bacterium]|nr:DUF2079 domain-containing protein [Anaerolineales bacterium]
MWRFLAPEILALALPSVAINLLADFAPMHEVTTLIYAAPIVAFVMLATVIGVARAGTLWARSGQRANARGRVRQPAPANWVATSIVIGGALIGQRLDGYLPGSGHYLALAVNDHHRAAQTVIDQIPADASVSAQDRLDPHVSGRSTVYLFPRIEDADTVFLDVTGSAWPLHPSDLKAQVDTLLAGDYGVAAANSGYLLLSKQAASDVIPPEFYTAWTMPSPAMDVQTTLPLSVTFGDELRLLDAKVGVDRYGELVTEFTWEALRPIDRDLRFYVGYLDQEGNVLHDSLFYPPVTALWYPTRMWSPGQPVTVRMLPWTLSGDAFALVAGVYEGDNGWSEGKRLPVTSSDVTLPILESDTVVRLGGFAKTPGNGNWSEVAPDQGAPAPALDLLFGDSIRLTAAETAGKAKPGSTIPVRLAWQTTRSPALDYSRFVHLLDATGAKVAQFDSAPGDAIGKLPFSNWPQGWRGLDTVLLETPANLAPGDYTIVTGLYDWQSGARLPVAGAATGDTYVVGQVRIEP